MNPLPVAWHCLLETRPVIALVLIDGSLQHDLGARLSRSPGTVLSLFADLPVEAQALGPWLLTADEAIKHGIDGSGPGVNWLASETTLANSATHLRLWMRDGELDGMHYSRLADGRVLRAAMTVWTPAQRAAFCAPWQGWWLADRDGRALPLALPDKYATHDPTAGEPGWTPEQHAALARLTLPDRLLQQIKHYVHCAPTVQSREARHALAAKMLAVVERHGYQSEPDQSAWIAWALMKGHCPDDGLDHHPVHAQYLHGDALWDALMDDAQPQPDVSADDSLAGSP